MDNNFNDIDLNDPKIQKAFAFFQQQQQQQQQQQMQQMLFQQQQQYMMQQQFIMQQQRQQLWNEFLQYCQMTGSNSNDQNLFNQYCQMKISFMNNFPQQQQQQPQQPQQPNQTPLNPPTIYVNSPDQSSEQKPRDDTVYLGNNNQQPKETLPRMNKTIYADVQGSGNNINNFNMMKQFGMGGNNDMINVTLIATSGLKVVIPAPKTMSLCQLFKNYVQKVGVPESVIGTKIVFLFNAEKLDYNSQEPIYKFFKNFQANITVLDQANIIGA